MWEPSQNDVALEQSAPPLIFLQTFSRPQILHIKGSVYELWRRPQAIGNGMRFLCARTCFVLVFLGGWSEGFMRVLEMAQNHCSLRAHGDSCEQGHLWMALWLTAPGTATCVLENSDHGLSKVFRLLPLLGVEVEGGLRSFPPLCSWDFCFPSSALYRGEPLSVCSPWCIVFHLVSDHATLL